MNAVWVDMLLKDPRVRKWLVQAIGEHSIRIIREFDHELSDEDIAKKADLRASDARVVLNRLHAHGLASYSRSRDKNSGWYSYIWHLDEKHANQLAQGMIGEEELAPAARESGQELYYCEVDGRKVIYTFEQAVECNFKCPQSGQPLKYLE
jgi:transcription initiation factor TFIIE subunit alpha